MAKGMVPSDCQCVILAGGRGTRIAEETIVKPKPMVEIGTRPILWHIMKIYGYFGVTDFIVCLGYRGEMIKDYFVNSFNYGSDITVDLSSHEIVRKDRSTESWKVTLADTGEESMTAGRLQKIADYIRPDRPFFLTYGDGLSNIDISSELAFHNSHQGLVTMAAVRPPARFGTPVIEGDRVTSFLEKSQADEGFINGGFFIVQPEVLGMIEGELDVWETGPLAKLAADSKLFAWRHEDFWSPMDTLRERNYLESLWESGSAPWKLWEG